MDERPEQLPDLDRLARANEDATWGDAAGGRVRVPGVLSGDVGPKGQVAAQLSHLSRRERIAGSEVPPGTVSANGARLVLLPMLAIALLLLGAVCVFIWLVS